MGLSPTPMTHGSASPPCHPGRSVFPSPVGDHSFPMSSSQRGGGFSAHAHPPLQHAVDSMRETIVSCPPASGPVSWGGTRTVPALTESPFAPPRCDLGRRRVARSLGQRYPTLIAPTGSCVRPRSALALGFRPEAQSSPVAVSPGWKEVFPGVISANLSSDVWPPTPAALMVLVLVSSHEASAFPNSSVGRHLARVPAQQLHAGVSFRGCRHFLDVQTMPIRLLPSMIESMIAKSCSWIFINATIFRSLTRFQSSSGFSRMTKPAHGTC